MSKTVSINASMVQNNDDYKVNFNYSDSDGVEVEYANTGKDLLKLVNDMTDTLIDSIQEQLVEPEEEAFDINDDDDYVEMLERLVEELDEENKSLKTDLGILQHRADNAVKSSKSLNNKKANIKTKKIDIDDLFNEVLNFWY